MPQMGFECFCMPMCLSTQTHTAGGAGEVAVIGGGCGSSQQRADIYNVQTDVWRSIDLGIYRQVWWRDQDQTRVGCMEDFIIVFSPRSVLFCKSRCRPRPCCPTAAS